MLFTIIDVIGAYMDSPSPAPTAHIYNINQKRKLHGLPLISKLEYQQNMAEINRWYQSVD